MEKDPESMEKRIRQIRKEQNCPDCGNYLEILDNFEVVACVCGRSFEIVKGVIPLISISILKTISIIQIENITTAEWASIQFDKHLYEANLEGEHLFHSFMHHDKLLFLVLGDSGTGKTWYSSSLALEYLEKGHIVFYVDLAKGIETFFNIIFNRSLNEGINEINAISNKLKQPIIWIFDNYNGLKTSNRDDLFDLLRMMASFKQQKFILLSQVETWKSYISANNNQDEFQKLLFAPEAGSESLLLKKVYKIRESEPKIVETRIEDKIKSTEEESSIENEPLLKLDELMGIIPRLLRGRSCGSIPITRICARLNVTEEDAIQAIELFIKQEAFRGVIQEEMGKIHLLLEENWNQSGRDLEKIQALKDEIQTLLTSDDLDLTKDKIIHLLELNISEEDKIHWQTMLKKIEEKKRLVQKNEILDIIERGNFEEAIERIEALLLQDMPDEDRQFWNDELERLDDILIEQEENKKAEKMERLNSLIVEIEQLILEENWKDAKHKITELLSEELTTDQKSHWETEIQKVQEKLDELLVESAKLIDMIKESNANYTYDISLQSIVRLLEIKILEESLRDEYLLMKDDISQIQEQIVQSIQAIEVAETLEEKALLIEKHLEMAITQESKSEWQNTLEEVKATLEEEKNRNSIDAIKKAFKEAATPQEKIEHIGRMLESGGLDEEEQAFWQNIHSHYTSKEFNFDELDAELSVGVLFNDKTSDLSVPSYTDSLISISIKISHPVLLSMENLYLILYSPQMVAIDESIVFNGESFELNNMGEDDDGLFKYSFLILDLPTFMTNNSITNTLNVDLQATVLSPEPMMDVHGPKIIVKANSILGLEIKRECPIMAINVKHQRSEFNIRKSINGIDENRFAIEFSATNDGTTCEDLQIRDLMPSGFQFKIKTFKSDITTEDLVIEEVDGGSVIGWKLLNVEPSTVVTISYEVARVDPKADVRKLMSVYQG
ncbi:MAG: ATP-binding protein [Candidatus Heimdallarchaeota archaeon]|nr:ATP-binding protein [Candidatus Heimdallarchaeota archaeon]